MSIRVIITGATGMVGEGVLMECLQNENVSHVLSISRKPYEMAHPKFESLVVPDFFKIETFKEQLKGYDACFYCAGISSVGMKEEQYTKITYDTTLHVAKLLAGINPGMVFDFVTGAQTDSTEKGRSMWARVKGRTENDLMKLPFRGQYNFRPGIMKPFKEQKNIKTIFKIFLPVFLFLFSKRSITLQQLGRAMVKTVTAGYSKQVLEIEDIKKLAG